MGFVKPTSWFSHCQITTGLATFEHGKALSHGLYKNQTHTRLALAQVLMQVNPVAHGFTHHITSTHMHLWPTLFVALKAQVIFTFVQSLLTWGWLKWTWATTHWNLKVLVVHNALLGSSFVFTIQAVLVMAWAKFSLLPSGISSKMLTIATTYAYYGKTQCNNAPEYNLKKEWVFSLHPKLQILCRNFAYKQQASKQAR